MLTSVSVIVCRETMVNHVTRDKRFQTALFRFAMAFSVFVEMLNLRIRGKAPEPVKLRRQYVEAQKIGE